MTYVGHGRIIMNKYVSMPYIIQRAYRIFYSFVCHIVNTLGKMLG